MSQDLWERAQTTLATESAASPLLERRLWNESRGLRARVRAALSWPTLAAIIVAAVILAATVIAVIADASRAEQLIPDTAWETADTAEISAGEGTAPDPALSNPTTAGSAADSTATVFLHVSGEVHRPGVVVVSSEARVADAIEAAGGFTDAAAQDATNLARLVVDGEQIHVPHVGEAPLPPVAAGGSAPAPSAPTPGGGAGASGTVSLNQADQATLESLPGVGPVLAGRIIDWRTSNGPFTKIEQLQDVSGVGPKVFAKLEPHLSL